MGNTAQVNFEVVLEAIREQERWQRMYQVNTVKLNEANATERDALMEQHQVIKKHLNYYDNLITEMKQVYSPTGIKHVLK